MNPFNQMLSDIAGDLEMDRLREDGYHSYSEKWNDEHLKECLNRVNGRTETYQRRGRGSHENKADSR